MPSFGLWVEQSPMLPGQYAYYGRFLAYKINTFENFDQGSCLFYESQGNTFVEEFLCADTLRFSWIKNRGIVKNSMHVMFTANTGNANPKDDDEMLYQRSLPFVKTTWAQSVYHGECVRGDP
jgi:hypothetical protein